MIPSRVLPPSAVISEVRGGGLGRVPSATGYRLGSPGRPPKLPCRHSLLFDNSGSVDGLGGNDPVRQRFTEAWQAIQLLARAGGTRTEVGITSFDVPFGLVEPGPLDDHEHLAELRRNLRSGTGGSSWLTQSLEIAIGWATARPDWTHVTTIFSDFELFDDDQIWARLASFPGDVHAVVLGAEPDPRLLSENVLITRVAANDPPGSVATALWSSLTTGRKGTRRGSLPITTQSASEFFKQGAAA